MEMQLYMFISNLNRFFGNFTTLPLGTFAPGASTMGTAKVFVAFSAVK